MIPIVIGGTPVSRFWVIGGVDAMMNGYPWVVQLKLHVPPCTDIRPEKCLPPGVEQWPGSFCGGTVINSRLAFLNFDIIYVIKKLLLPSYCYMSVMNVENNTLRGSCHYSRYFCFHKKEPYSRWVASAAHCVSMSWPLLPANRVSVKHKLYRDLFPNFVLRLSPRISCESWWVRTTTITQ